MMYWYVLCGLYKDQLQFLVDLYFEGLDQYCGWFYLLLLMVLMIDGCVLYKGLFMYGFMVDGEGCKMSKLFGNGIDLYEVVNCFGVEIICLWIVLIDYLGEFVIFEEILKCVIEGYCCICNMLCFLFVNLLDFDFVQYVVLVDEWFEIDCYVVVFLQ